MNIIARTLSIAKRTKQRLHRTPFGAVQVSPNLFWGLLRSFRSLATLAPHASAGVTKTPELDTLSAYAEWAHNYPAHAHNALMRAEEQVMRDLMPNPHGIITLDLGCGTGRYARILNERGAARIIAADLSPEMLEGADKRTAHFIQANLTQLPLTNSYFDLVVCGLAIGHIEDLSSAIAEISRVLKRGGTLLYSDFHPLGSLAGWQREFTGRDGQRYAVEHHAHLYADHDAACRAAELRIIAVREPIIGRDITENFPGSDEVYTRWNGWPVALVIRAEKL